MKNKVNLNNCYLIRLIVDEYGEVASMWFHDFKNNDEIKTVISNSKINDFDKIINNKKFLTATVYPDNQILNFIIMEKEKGFNKQKKLSTSESELFNLNQCDFYDVWNDNNIDIVFIDFPEEIYDEKTKL